MNRIAALREARDWSQQDLADRLDTTPVSVGRYEKEDQRLTLPLLRRLANIFQTSVSDVIGESHIASSAMTEAFTTVKRYDAQFSAGAGSIIDPNAEPLGLAVLETQWLRALTVARPDELAVVRVAGDSMERTLFDNDWVLMDRTQQRISREGIYALQVMDNAWIKRISLNLSAKKVRVISDNPVYPVNELDESELVILGRILSLVARRIT
jgi:phage repressor protein C with HTH and peptisase S24 domain